MLDTNTVSVSETEISSVLAGETEESAAKRTRASPIQKSFDRVDALMEERIEELRSMNEENSDEELDLTAVIEFAEGLRVDLNALRVVAPIVAAPRAEGAPRRGRPKGSKNKPKGEGHVAAAPKSAGAWYVGVAADGTRSAFKAGAVPSAATHTDFATVYGPVSTKNGAEYRAARTNEELAAKLVEMPVVFA